MRPVRCPTLGPPAFVRFETIGGERRLSTSTRSLQHIERAGLMVLDIEVLRLHHANTLQVGPTGSRPIGKKPRALKLSRRSYCFASAVEESAA